MSKEQLKTMYPECFDGIGKFNDYKYLISKEDNAKPVIHPARKVVLVIMNFLHNRTIIWIWRQAFASLQHDFLRSEENVVLYNFETHDVVWENVVSCNILTL